jgi:glycosyltransferase involved in cell wall biosynthesis
MTGRQKQKRALLLAVSHPDAIGGQAACARMLLQNFKDVEWMSISFPLPNTHRAFIRFIFSIRILLHALWICITKKIDVVHLLTACGRSALFEKLIIARILKFTGVKVVINFQGAFDYYYSSFSSRDRSAIKKLLRAPDIILCLHADIKKFLIENKIAPADKIRVIPNAVPVETPLIKNKNDPYDVRLTYIGWLVTNKGLHTLVKAAGILFSEYHIKNFSLAIIGPEIEKGIIKKLEDDAMKSGIADRLKITGPVFGGEKNNAFASTDIFVFPTRMEGFPFVLLEAMQAGLPVVTTNVSPMNLIVTHEVTGLLFKKDDAADLASNISDLISDKELRLRIGAEAKRHVEANYSVGKIMMMYRDLYAKL